MQDNAVDPKWNAVITVTTSSGTIVDIESLKVGWRSSNGTFTLQGKFGRLQLTIVQMQHLLDFCSRLKRFQTEFKATSAKGEFFRFQSNLCDDLKAEGLMDEATGHLSAHVMVSEIESLTLSGAELATLLAHVERIRRVKSNEPFLAGASRLPRQASPHLEGQARQAQESAQALAAISPCGSSKQFTSKF